MLIGILSFLLLSLVSAELAVAGAVRISSEAIVKGGCLFYKFVTLASCKQWTYFVS